MRFYIILYLLVFVLSCNIFHPRDSEEPSKPPEWNIITNTADRCLENLLFVYNYKQNAINYHRILSDQFTFNFDLQDVQDFGVPVVWGKQQEIEMLINLHQYSNKYQDIFLYLEQVPNQTDNYGATSVTFFRNYILRIDSLNKTLKGRFQLLVEKDTDGLWRIKTWHDYRINDIWTWGRLKDEFG